MIEFANESDVISITELWKEAFGDEYEDIKRYLDIYLKYVLVYRENGKVMGMLSLLPVEKNGDKGRYIYAVATFKECRGKGISTKLLDYTKQFIKSANEKFCILVPASESLFEFYKKRGFKTVSCIKRAEFNIGDLNKSDLSVEKITADEYAELRNKYLSQYNLVKWSVSELENISMLYGGSFYKICEIDAAYFAVKNNDTLYIKELCCKNIDEAAAAAMQNDRCKKVFTVSDGNSPFAMIYPGKYENVYFNIALD